MQLQNLKDSLPEHIVKYNEFKQAEMQLNKIKNKLENFTKALRNESCLPSGQSDSGPYYISKSNEDFNKFLKTNMFGDKIPENYLIGGALLGKLLSCDNGIIGKILENLYEERIILPGIDLSRYLIERLLGNEMEDRRMYFYVK